MSITIVEDINVQVYRIDANEYLRRARRPALPEVNYRLRAAVQASEPYAATVEFTLPRHTAERFCRLSKRPIRLSQSYETLQNIVRRALSTQPVTTYNAIIGEADDPAEPGDTLPVINFEPIVPDVPESDDEPDDDEIEDDDSYSMDQIVGDQEEDDAVVTASNEDADEATVTPDSESPLTAEDVQGGFYPDITGGETAEQHLANLRGDDIPEPMASEQLADEPGPVVGDVANAPSADLPHLIADETPEVATGQFDREETAEAAQHAIERGELDH